MEKSWRVQIKALVVSMRVETLQESLMLMPTTKNLVNHKTQSTSLQYSTSQHWETGHKRSRFRHLSLPWLAIWQRTRTTSRLGIFYALGFLVVFCFIFLSNRTDCAETFPTFLAENGTFCRQTFDRFVDGSRWPALLRKLTHYSLTMPTIFLIARFNNTQVFFGEMWHNKS